MLPKLYILYNQAIRRSESDLFADPLVYCKSLGIELAATVGTSLKRLHKRAVTHKLILQELDVPPAPLQGVIQHLDLVCCV